MGDLNVRLNPMKIILLVAALLLGLAFLQTILNLSDTWWGMGRPDPSGNVWVGGAGLIVVVAATVIAYHKMKD